MSLIGSTGIRTRIILSLSILFSGFLGIVTLIFYKTSRSAPAVADALQGLYLISLIAGVFMVALIGYLLSRTITSPLEILQKKVASLLEGDLTARHGQLEGDEVGQLGNMLDEFAEHLGHNLDQMVRSVTEVIQKVDKLRHNAAENNQGSEDQATQAVEIASTVEEMSQSINSIAQNAAEASDSSMNSMETARGGHAVAQKAMVSMTNYSSSTLDLNKLIEKLDSSVSEIGDILTVINEIADQTNLLALNAAIEAARAGEQGRGFAVVADEVRKLAERTVKATSEISGRIINVQNETEETTNKMNESMSMVEQAGDSLTDVSNALSGIIESAKTVQDQVSHIATAVEEQSTATEQISGSIETSSKISSNIYTKSTAVLTEVDEVTNIVDKIRTSIAIYKTPGRKEMVLELSKGDHRLWVNRVAAHLNGQARLEADKLNDHTKCRLGKWYYGEGMEACGTSDAFVKLEDPHKRVHQIGKEIIQAYDRGEHERANGMFLEMEEVSKNIIVLIDNLEGNCGGGH